ncbi:MAG TPA: hypothetical protein VLC51_06790, partial [Nitrospira sp.]|nr:hypothetical protein [Nitrospira sp.]
MKNRKFLLPRLAAMSLAILFSTAFATAQAPHSPAALGLPIVNIDEPGRTPYQTAAFGHCNGTVCHATFEAIPAGHRLVITHVSGTISSSDAVPDGTRVLLSMSNGVQFMSAPVSPFIPGVFVGGFDQPVEFYVDGGESPTVQANIGVSGIDVFNPSLIGYELDCAKVSCAP